jgi:membrane protein YqaA with SNARE-associated domain
VLVAAGSAAGVGLLAWLFSGHQQSALAVSLLRLLHGPGWERGAALIRRDGALGIGLISFSFLPQQPAVIIAALAKMPLGEIVAPVFVARGIKYLAYGALAANAPHLLLQFKRLRRWIPESVRRRLARRAL